MKKTLILITLLSSYLFAGVATITAIKGEASIKRGESTLVALLGSQLEEKDNIVTKDNTKLQVIFKDETIISIGKNSDFSINEYLFEDKQTPIAKFSMLKGAMRTITGAIGDIAPEKFSVATKTATIGIRGTNFSVVAGDNGAYSAYCTFGAISVDIQGQSFLVPQGFFVTVTPEGTVSVNEFSPEDLKDMKKDNFDFEEKEGEDQGLRKEGTQVVLDDTGNNEQIDVTVNDTSTIVITDATESTTEAIREVTSGDLASLLAGYTMTNATYTGDYTITTVSAGGDSGWQDGSTGTIQLDINFGADTAKLTFDNGVNIDGTSLSTNTFSGTGFNTTRVDPGAETTETISGTFSGEIGQNVAGDFSINTGGTGNDVGTYTATTSQTLQ